MDWQQEWWQYLDDSISKTLDLIKEYEDKRRTSDNPKEKADCERQLADLYALLEGYQSKLNALSYVTRHVRCNLRQPDYGRFVGRGSEMAELQRQLRPYPHSQFSTIVIHGVGGVGKSALAQEIASSYLWRYQELPPDERFEVIVWVSAKTEVLTPFGTRQRYRPIRTLDDIRHVQFYLTDTKPAKSRGLRPSFRLRKTQTV